MSSNQSDNLSNSIIVRVQCSIRVILMTFCRSIVREALHEPIHPINVVFTALHCTYFCIFRQLQSKVMLIIVEFVTRLDFQMCRGTSFYLLNSVFTCFYSVN